MKINLVARGSLTCQDQIKVLISEFFNIYFGITMASESRRLYNRVPATRESLKDLMKTLTAECEAKEELVAAIQRRIYECDQILSGYNKDLAVFDAAFAQERANPAWTPEERDQANKGRQHLLARIDGIKDQHARAFKEMFLEYQKIKEMRSNFELCVDIEEYLAF